jgi:hypothetical protein
LQKSEIAKKKFSKSSTCFTPMPFSRKMPFLTFLKNPENRADFDPLFLLVRRPRAARQAGRQPGLGPGYWALNLRLRASAPQAPTTWLLSIGT